jgi:hypothetical protein
MKVIQSFMEKVDKIYEEVNIKFLVEEMEKDAEEYGQLHNEDCGVNREDECDCENMQLIKAFSLEWMAKVNEKWVKMTRAHLPYCRPQGSEFLVRGYGGKVKSAEHKQKISEGVRKAKAV